jgi:hypothetical protein
MVTTGIRRALGALVSIGFLVVCTSGCSSSSADFGGPLSITLTVDRTSGRATVDEFAFHYEASGTELLGVVLDFGDGQVDSLSAQGASRAGAIRIHVYELAGMFSATAREVPTQGRSRENLG